MFRLISTWSPIFLFSFLSLWSLKFVSSSSDWSHDADMMHSEKVQLFTCDFKIMFMLTQMCIEFCFSDHRFSNLCVSNHRWIPFEALGFYTGGCIFNTAFYMGRYTLLVYSENLKLLRGYTICLIWHLSDSVLLYNSLLILKVLQLNGETYITKPHSNL